MFPTVLSYSIFALFLFGSSAELLADIEKTNFNITGNVYCLNTFTDVDEPMNGVNISLLVQGSFFNGYLGDSRSHDGHFEVQGSMNASKSRIYLKLQYKCRDGNKFVCQTTKVFLKVTPENQEVKINLGRDKRKAVMILDGQEVPLEMDTSECNVLEDFTDDLVKIHHYIPLG